MFGVEIRKDRLCVDLADSIFQNCSRVAFTVMSGVIPCNVVIIKQIVASRSHRTFGSVDAQVRLLRVRKRVDVILQKPVHQSSETERMTFPNFAFNVLL